MNAVATRSDGARFRDDTNYKFIVGHSKTIEEAAREAGVRWIERSFMVFNFGETKTAGGPGWEGLDGGL